MESETEIKFPEHIKSGRLLNAISELYGGEGVNLTSERHTAADYSTLVEKAEKFLEERAEMGDTEAIFLLGQLYYEECLYAKAEQVFDSIKETDPRALYQLGVIYFDGLGSTVDQQTKAVEYMKRVASWDSPEATSIKHSALFNIGRAYLDGYGVKPSSDEAERYWLLAADDGNPNGSVKAQTSLGLLYSNWETLDLRRAFFWHSEACGNGSLESQGALGVMYLYGLGIGQDHQSALECLKEASERGNVYAQGNLVAYYYHRKLYSKAATLAKRMSEYDDIAAIGKSTDCLPEYISKGIAMALFHYGRCLQLGRGIKQDQEEAKEYFSKAAHFNPEVCRDLQMDVTFGKM